MCVSAIERCRKQCSAVEIIIVQGNHDFTRSYYLGMAIKQRYLSAPDITVNLGEEPRKYTVWGNSLVCFTHGDNEVKGKLPLIISREQPEEWGRCKYIEIHKGHLHKEQETSLVMTNEESQIKERVLPSLVSCDDWHKLKGYSHIRESQGFVWNQQNGNIAILKYHF